MDDVVSVKKSVVHLFHVVLIEYSVLRVAENYALVLYLVVQDVVKEHEFLLVVHLDLVGELEFEEILNKGKVGFYERFKQKLPIKFLLIEVFGVF